MPEDFRPVRMRSADLPAADRIAVWRECYGRRIIKLDIEPLPDSDFHVDVTMRTMPGLRVVTGGIWGTSDRPTPELIVGDDIGISINRGGRHHFVQRGHEVDPIVGNAVVISLAEPALLTRRKHNQILGVRIPRSALAQSVPDLDDAIMRVIPREAPALKLLTAYVTSLDDIAMSNAALRRAAVAHVHELAALVIAGSDDEVDGAGRGVRAARTQQILAEISANYADSSLSASRVAARLRLSPRYLHELLQETGAPFTERVLALRLDKAMAMLTDRRNDRMKVSDVAYACGFNDASYFNRRFRRQYDATPLEVRLGRRPTTDKASLGG
jgi:AraC-like DNA-binding protein